jgi:hypothetical protein
MSFDDYGQNRVQILDIFKTNKLTQKQYSK